MEARSDATPTHTFLKGYSEEKYRKIIQGGSGAFGNAATRMETFVGK